jgi:hypothetical protein
MVISMKGEIHEDHCYTSSLYRIELKLQQQETEDSRV